jgi:hypothetical protein
VKTAEELIACAMVIKAQRFAMHLHLQEFFEILNPRATVTICAGTAVAGPRKLRPWNA